MSEEEREKFPIERDVNSADVVWESLQHVANELHGLSRYHQKIRGMPEADVSWSRYYKEVDVVLERVHSLFEALKVNRTPNDRIGQYLVAAKNRAKAIVREAEKEGERYTRRSNGRVEDRRAPGHSLKQRVPQVEESTKSRKIERPITGMAELRQVEQERQEAIALLVIFLEERH